MVIHNDFNINVPVQAGFELSHVDQAACQESTFIGLLYSRNWEWTLTLAEVNDYTRRYGKATSRPGFATHQNNCKDKSCVTYPP